jgi:hypothetical protein
MPYIALQLVGLQVTIAAGRRPTASEHCVIRGKLKAFRVHAKHATSVQPVSTNNAELCSALPANAKAHAHDLSNEALAILLVNSGLGPTLRKLSELLPYLDELTKRFTHLRKGQTIMGYASMNAFCLGELHRTSRAVRYALHGRTPSKNRAEKSEPKSFWEALAHSLNELVPSSSDGIEHKLPNQIEAAILKIQAGEEIEPKWTLDQIVFNCQEISAIFGIYAKMLDPKRAEEFLANPNIAKADERLREKLSRRTV